MDSKAKCNLNLKTLGFMKLSLNYFVLYLWLMYSTKKLWFAMEDYHQKIILLCKILDKLIDFVNHLKEVQCVIYFGQIQFYKMAELQAREEYQWDSVQTLQQSS